MAARPQNLASDRAEAERTFYEGTDLLAGVALAFEGEKAADTDDNNRSLAGMLDAGISRLVTARRLFLDRAEQR